jgi:hypothetical protein
MKKYAPMINLLIVVTLTSALKAFVSETLIYTVNRYYYNIIEIRKWKINKFKEIAVRFI